MPRIKKILIIEDDDNLAKVLYDRLKVQENLRVTIALDGEEAKKKFLKFNPDVLIIDIELPDTNGFELLKEFRYLDPYARVIFISAYGTDENKKMAEELNADRFFEKPFELDDIIHEINRQ